MVRFVRYYHGTATDAIKLAMQQFHNRNRLLHVHWCVFVLCVDNAIGVGNRFNGAWVTES